jgi:hypothetical protein
VFTSAKKETPSLSTARDVKLKLNNMTYGFFVREAIKVVDHALEAEKFLKS